MTPELAPRDRAPRPRADPARAVLPVADARGSAAARRSRTRLALRDLARYRARSGSALAAISVGVLVAVIVMLAAAARYGNVLDYAGPNLASNELALHANTPPPAGTTFQAERHQVANGPSLRPATSRRQLHATPSIARALGAQLDRPRDPGCEHRPGRKLGRSWDGPIYVATPQLLKAFGIKAVRDRPERGHPRAHARVSRASPVFLTYGLSGNEAPKFGPPSSTCTAATSCLPDPVIQEIGHCPAGHRRRTR